MLARGQVGGDGLGEPLTGRGRHDRVGAVGTGDGDVVQRPAPDVRPHHHARAAAVRARRPRCGAGRWSSPAGRAPRARSRPSAIALPSNDSRSGARYAGEDRDDVDAHAARTCQANIPSGGSTTSPPAARSTVGHDRRARTAPAPRTPSGRRTGEHRRGRAGADLDDRRPAPAPAASRTRQPDQLVVVELVRVVGRPAAVRVGHGQRRAAQRLGGVAVGDALEPQQQPAAGPPPCGDGQRPAGRPGRCAAPRRARTARPGRRC